MNKTKMEDLRIVDNFYQTSSYFPMPTTLIGTLAEDGITTFGAYSLCFPFYVAGKDYYAMMLNCRNSSNTCRNILRTGKCSINFPPADKRILKEVVRLGFPGDTAAEKMKDFRLTPADGLRKAEDPTNDYPQVIEESYQTFECTWVKEIDGAQNDSVRDEYAPPYHTCNGITSEFGAHFILRIDKILMQPRYRKAIINGVKAKDFPSVPVDYGYRDSKNFWIAAKKRPYAETVQGRAVDVDSVMYAANRIDPDVKFTKDACMRMVKVPRIFLNTALKGCVKWAKEHHVNVLNATHMERINDKRGEEKQR